jgi:serine hydrolase
MPDPLEAKRSVWLPYLRDELHCDERTLVIGHSSGAVAVLRLLETDRLCAAVSVSPCHTDLGEVSERISGYYDPPWLWEHIRGHCDRLTVVADANDPFIPVVEARYVRDHVHPHAYHERKFGNHFMQRQLPFLRDLVFSEIDHLLQAGDQPPRPSPL